ncbi:acyltransferase family protein [Kytococcus sp. Marseille-QA3725]
MESAGARRERDWVVDVVRLSAMLVVVTMHWCYLHLWMEDGLQLELALSGRVVWALTWLLQVMPAFFVAGGFTNTLLVDRWRASGDPLGAYLGLRARRLASPVVPLLVVALLAVLLGGALVPGVTATIGDQIANPLWFLAVYLVCTALAPLTVLAFDRLGWWSAAFWLAGALVVDVLRFWGDTDLTRWNLLFVWAFCHQLGIAYARRRGWGAPTWQLVAVVLVCAALLVAMVVPGPWFPTNLGVRDAPVSNLAPATAALAVLGVAQWAVLTAVGRRLLGHAPSPAWQRRISTGNALAMLIYLWHVPAMTLMIGIGMLAPDLLLPRSMEGWWMVRPVWFVLSGAMLAVLVLGAMRWEVWFSRFEPTRTTWRGVLGAALAAVAVHQLWASGFGLAPLQLLWAAALLVAVGLLTARARVEA